MLRAATEAEKRQLDVATWQAWGSGLTVEQFCERELRLRAHRWARDAMTTWLWVDQHGAVLASCETYGVSSHVGTAPGRAWSIASVFVESALRGQGHALQLMKALVEKLSDEPGAQAVVLFSEVGAGLYERAGFISVPAWDVCFPACRSSTSIEWLLEPGAQPPPREAPNSLLISATADEVDWHLESERCYASALGRAPLEHHGARLGGSTIAWAAYHRTKELHVLWLDAVDPAHRTPLISAARHAAFRIGLERVRIWETTSLAGLLDAERTPRDEALPMFAPFTPGLTRWSDIHRAVWV